MQCNDKRATLVGNQRQVLFKPAQLLVCDKTVVVAAAGNTCLVFRAFFTLILIIDVIENHIMHFAEVERIVIGSHQASPRSGTQEIRGLTVRHRRVVVVIAHDGPHGHAVTLLAASIQKVWKCISVGKPIIVPRQVSQQQGMDHTFAGILTLTVKSRRETAELFHITRPVGQMRVGTDNHHIVVAPLATHQPEIADLCHRLVGTSERCPKTRTEAIGHFGFIAPRQCIENVSVAFVRL